MKKWEWWVVAGVALVALYWAYGYVTGNNPISGVLRDALNPGDNSGSGGGGVSATILSAISSFENVAGQHNNPGGICGGFDASGNCTGPKTYDSLADGIAAAQAKIDGWIQNNPALTVEQFVKKWSGATGQVLDNYVQHVSDALGLDPNDPIADAGGDDDGDVDQG